MEYDYLNLTAEDRAKIKAMIPLYDPQGTGEFIDSWTTTIKFGLVAARREWAEAEGVEIHGTNDDIWNMLRIQVLRYAKAKKYTFLIRGLSQSFSLLNGRAISRVQDVVLSLSPLLISATASLS